MMTSLAQKITRLWPGRAPWWPEGASYALDFAGRRYMRLGEHCSLSEALTFSRPGEAWGRDSQHKIHAFSANQMRLTDLGLQLEGARTRLSRAPLDLAGSHWINEALPGLTILPPEGLFTAPCRIASDGQIFARRAQTLSLSNGQTVHVKCRYRAGTSGRFGIYMRTATTGQQSIIEGAVGALTVNSVGGGLWAGVINTDMGAGLYEIDADFTPSTTQNDWRFACAPRSTTMGEYVDVLGAMLVDGAGPCEWIFGPPETTIRANEQLTLALPPGSHQLTLKFRTGANHIIPFASGSYTLDPTILAGRALTLLATGSV